MSDDDKKKNISNNFSEDGDISIGGEVSRSQIVGKRHKGSSVSAGNNSIVIGGNVNGSNVVHGNNNVVTNNISNVSVDFESIYRTVDENPKLSPAEKVDVKAEIKDVEKEINNGDKADESGVMRHLRNVQRMAPDIVDVVIATLSNPVAGLGMVAKKIADKAAAEFKSEG